MSLHNEKGQDQDQDQDQYASSPAVDHSMNIETGSSQSGHSEMGYNTVDVVRARSKFDFIVIPVVTFLYFLNFLDRANIGNARASGLLRDLKLTNHQYSICLTVTYVPYIFMDLPSNLLLKRVGPNILLPLYVSAWGIVACLQGLVTNYAGLLACRFFLGLCEGGLFPGIVLYVSSLYERNHLLLRIAIICTATSLAGAFSGLLAYAISHMDGVGGRRGWSWIFILEGLFTVVVGVPSALFLPRTVATAKFLTTKEKFAMLAALKADQNCEQEIEPLYWREILSVLKAPQVLIMLPNFFGCGIILYGLAYFTPSIINSLGYSPIYSQLLSVPPYACAFVVSIILAFASDRWRARGPVSVLAGLLAMTGYIMFHLSYSKHVRYGSLFLSTTGAYVAAPTAGSWMPNNVMPHYRRATAVAMAYIMTSSGGIASAWIFTDPPHYINATKINIAFSVLISVSAMANMIYLAYANSRKRSAPQAGQWDGSSPDFNEEKPKDLFNAAELESQKRKLGDRHHDFMYTL